ncbi:MAG TPA: protein translocase subunit SecD [Longimicrobiales bacterium]|nr:protein translocase subunit SecD [Longimicrobiales bacterium]
MFGTIKGRIAIILVIAGIALGSLFTQGITLGLDLRGGMYLALEVADPEGTMTSEVKRQNIEQNLQILRNRIDEFGVSERTIQAVGDERIVVALPGVRDEERARSIIERQAFLEWSLVRPTEQLRNALERIDRVVATTLPESERAAVTPTQQSGESVQDLMFRRGRDTTAADTSAADSARAAAGDTSVTQEDSAAAAASAARPFSSLLLDSGQPGEFLVLDQDVARVSQYLALPGVREALPRGAVLKWGSKPVSQGAQLYRQLYLLDRAAFLTGDQLENAQAGRDPQYNETIVTFTLNRRGGRTFEDVTSKNLGNRIAIVLDEQVHSAPVVQSRIGASGQITMGQAPMEEARDLALVLRAGAFTAPLEIVEQRSVGPSLGADSIRQGMIAGIIGIVLVIVVMMLYYRLAGVLAVGALIIYALLVLGGLSLIPNATLTAPGIAGFILSLGMAVDANVLIFERIREELLAGRTVRLAVEAGFQHAMSAIVDSNLTTLITALILFRVGTGPVQGFAVTLSIGIVASFFSAVFVTRTLFLIYLERRRTSEALSI